MNWIEELKTLIKARYPAIWLVTDEEERIVQAIREEFYFKPYMSILDKIKGDGEEIPEEEKLRLIEESGIRKIYEWSAVKGITEIVEGADEKEIDSAAQDVYSALGAIINLTQQKQAKSIFVLKDPHEFLRDPLSIRQFKETYFALKTTYSSIIIVSPILQIPTELQKMITVIDIPLPTQEELKRKLTNIIDDVNESLKLNLRLENGELEEIIKAGLGLTMQEFEHCVAKSIVKFRKIKATEIVKEKEQIIRKSGILEYYHSVETIKDIGGLELLKEWLIKRKAAFTDKAKKFGLKPPKGILLAGAAGTGKSLTAKVASNIFGFPLLRMDVSNVFGQYVGESEKNMRNALKLAESVAPSILWLDEVERIVAGHESSGSTDSGVTSRVIGQLLTWMQERTKPVFVIMTTNDPLALPPQLIRAGRLDEIFHVDLPNLEERKAIFSIHLKKVGRDPNNFDLDALAEATEGFVGAEIEQVIQDALYIAFSYNAEITTGTILDVVKETTPLSKKREAEIQRMREWAKNNAKPANRETTLKRKKKVTIEL